MTTFTGKQAGKLIELFADTPSDQVQALYASGLLTDLRDGNIAQVNREEFRRVLGLKPLNPPLDPLAEFFKTRSGLYVWSEFTNRILAPALAFGETAPATVGSPFDLTQDMADAEITKKLGNKHVFENAKVFCLHLKDALERQWGGVAGDLLNNGHANLFYVRGLNGEVFAVYVYWYAECREWGVYAYRLDDGRWYAGGRAFPCN